MANEINEIKHTDEEIARYERRLSAEILKCKAAIDRKKLCLEELQSKVIKNKKAIKETEEELIELENQLIELESMTGLDYLLLLQENNNKKFIQLTWYNEQCRFCHGNSQQVNSFKRNFRNRQTFWKAY